MKMAISFVAILFFLLTIGVGRFCMADEHGCGWRSGVARVDITPGEPLWMAGYGSRDHESDGTLCPIFLKALALQDAAGSKAVLITSDLLGFPKEMSDRIRSGIKERLWLEHAQIILSSSHTHSGPVLGKSLWSIYPLNEAQQKKVDAYSAKLEDLAVECAVKAFAAMKPARLFSGNGVARFAVNRRNNTEATLLDMHEFKGPVDHAVPVLKVVDEAGVLIAVAFGYACHATTLCEYQWCGDYPGFAQVELETAHPGVTAMFFAGCGADQNPLPRRTVPLARQYGRELAAAVERMLEEPMNELAASLKTEYVETELALAVPPTRERLIAVAEKADVFAKRAIEDFLKQLDEGKPLRTSYPYPIQMWQVGGQIIVVLGGEVVVDYAIFLKQMFGREAFVFGYSNDVMGYIPSLRVLHEGGYEGATAQMYYGMPAPWSEDVETQILSTARDMASKIGIPVKAGKP